MGVGKIYEWLLKHCSPALVIMYLCIGILLQILETPLLGKLSDSEIYGLIILNTLFVFLIDQVFFSMLKKAEEKKHHFEDEGI